MIHLYQWIEKKLNVIIFNDMVSMIILDILVTLAIIGLIILIIDYINPSSDGYEA